MKKKREEQNLMEDNLQKENVTERNLKGKKTKLQRGEHGYIDCQKKKRMTGTIIWAVIAAFIFILGLALNKWSKSNIFTIVSMLCVLPMAKLLVSYIVIAPYRTVEEGLYQEIMRLVKEEDTVFTDLVITSPEKIMNLDFLIIAGNDVLGLFGRKKEMAEKCSEYLKKELKLRGFSYHVKIMTGKAEFIRALKAARRLPEESEELQELIDYLRSLIA